MNDLSPLYPTRHPSDPMMGVAIGSDVARSMRARAQGRSPEISCIKAHNTQ